MITDHCESYGIRLRLFAEAVKSIYTEGDGHAFLGPWDWLLICVNRYTRTLVVIPITVNRSE